MTIYKKCYNKEQSATAKYIAEEIALINNNNNRAEALNNNKSEALNNNKLHTKKTENDKVNSRVGATDGKSNDDKVNVESNLIANKNVVTKKLSDSDMLDQEGKETSKQGDIAAKYVDLTDKSSAGSSLESLITVVDGNEIKNNTVNEEIAKDGAEIKSDKVNAKDMKAVQAKKKAVLTPKYLCIAPDSYPIEEVDLDVAKAFQNLILVKLIENAEKPLIECVGLKNGSLIYGCHNESGSFLVHSVATELNLKTTNISNLYKDQRRYKLTAKINSYLNINSKDVFKGLENYNEGLNTYSWCIGDIKKSSEYIEMSLEVDAESFQFISQKGFGLFAGMDKIKFCVVWN